MSSLAFLGDLYSVSWMEDSDSKSNLNGYTLKAQFDKVKKLVTNSEVLQFGTLGMGQEAVGKYQGELNCSKSTRDNCINYRWRYRSHQFDACLHRKSRQ